MNDMTDNHLWHGGTNKLLSHRVGLSHESWSGQVITVQESVDLSSCLETESNE